MKLLVCGGRDYHDVAEIELRMGEVCKALGVTLVIHGGAQGADSHAGRWATANGITVMEYRANWLEHGRAAGPIRNQLMLDQQKPDAVLAFPGGRGTADMIQRAERAGINVMKVPAP